MFNPRFSITPQLTNTLMRLESLRQTISTLHLTPSVLTSLRQSARLQTVHFSTYIEGNRLTLEQIQDLLQGIGTTFPGRERDAAEILGYYAALEHINQLALQRQSLTESDIQRLHALVMGGGKTTITPTPYRDGQNAIYDGNTKALVYLPPEAHDVPTLMANLVAWIATAEQEHFPCPLLAALAHYQFATIHPYYDGNGRTARLLTTLLLHRGGYDLNGLYSLEEYYAKNLQAYYHAISIGQSHNYYMGRAEADITPWLDYFCDGMVESLEAIQKHALMAYGQGSKDTSALLRTLDARQRTVLSLFNTSKVISTKDIQTFFAIKPRAARALCLTWLKNEFLVIKDSAKKKRTYQLHPDLEAQLFGQGK